MKARLRRSLLAAAAAFVSIASSAADTDARKFENYQGYSAGIFIPDSTRDSSGGLSIGGYFGHTMDAVGAIELGVFGANASRDGGDSDTYIGGSLALNWGRRDPGSIFAVMGGGGVQQKTFAGNEFATFVDVGVGFYPPFDHPRDKLRLELRWHGVMSETLTDRSMLSDVRLMAGVMIGGGKKPKRQKSSAQPIPAAAPAPAPQAAPTPQRKPRAIPDAEPMPIDDDIPEPEYVPPPAPEPPPPAEAEAAQIQPVAPAPEPPAAEPPASAVALLWDYNLYFDRGSHVLGEQELDVAKALAAEMRRNPEKVYELNGFADPTGPAARNQVLSTRRARFVRDYLLMLGVDRGQLLIRGRGVAGQAPFPETDRAPGEDARARRVEARVLEN